ncbi:MAG TPA: FxsA family protein [Candidatus Acidoferrales bacterium]|nr:FxsA family protein [Candidatus Acidoferrales bacterium]
MSRPPLWPLLAMIPLVEIFLLGRLGVRLGAAPLLLLVAATGALGIWLMRRAGRPSLQTLTRISAEPDPVRIARGWEQMLLFVAGILLLLPGPLSDLLGLTLLWPQTRRRLARALAASVARFIPATAPDAGSGRVVEGEIVRKNSRRRQP